MIECECGSTTFAQEQHGWEVRNCELIEFRGEIKACNLESEAFVADDGGPEYQCNNCGTPFPREVRS